MDHDGYGALEARLGHTFADADRLRVALTHKSFLNENPTPPRDDNERLEFLGDAVLDLAVGHLLMEAFPQRTEGELSKTRAQIVSEGALAEVGGALGLGEWLFLGRGEEQTGGRHKSSLLADACEAVIAAVYLDAGFEAALGLVRRLFGERVRLAFDPGSSDYKTRLQERAQSVLHSQPRYEVVEALGPDHDKTFEVALLLAEREVARGRGKSKKEAEQRAAERALARVADWPTPREKP